MDIGVRAPDVRQMASNPLLTWLPNLQPKTLPDSFWRHPCLPLLKSRAQTRLGWCAFNQALISPGLHPHSHYYRWCRCGLLLQRSLLFLRQPQLHSRVNWNALTSRRLPMATLRPLVQLLVSELFSYKAVTKPQKFLNGRVGCFFKILTCSFSYLFRQQPANI